MHGFSTDNDKSPGDRGPDSRIFWTAGGYAVKENPTRGGQHGCQTSQILETGRQSPRQSCPARSRPSLASSHQGQDLDKLVHLVARLPETGEHSSGASSGHRVCHVGKDLGANSGTNDGSCSRKVEGHGWGRGPTVQTAGAAPNKKMFFMGIMQQLLDKVKLDVLNLQTDQSVRQGFKDTSGNWHFQAWNRELQALEVDKTRAPVPHSEVLQLLETVVNQASKQAINRFHATRPLTENMTGEVVTILLDLSVRHPAGADLYQALGRLEGNAVFQLIGIQYR